MTDTPNTPKPHPLVSALAQEMIDGLNEFCAALAAGRPIHEHYKVTCRYRPKARLADESKGERKI